MGFSLLTMGALRAALPDTSWRELVVKLGYPVGFVIVITYIIGIGELSHVIAGSVEAFYAVVTGVATLSHVLVHFTLPVLLGNLVGGGALVGALHHAQVEADKAA